MKKCFSLTDLILNVLIILSTVFAIGAFFGVGPDALGASGKGCFRYFTIDSNILAALGSLIVIPWNLAGISGREKKVPEWIMILKYAGTVAVTLTFLTVVFFLGPTSALRSGIRGYFGLFRRNNFALHFSTPVLAILSFVLFEKEPELRGRKYLWGLVPTAVYSIVYMVLVVFTHTWTDWYGFTFGGKIFMIPVSLTVMYLATLGIGKALLKLRKGK